MLKLLSGPAIEQGFYYDFERDEPFTEEDLQKIETRMKELSAKSPPYYRTELSKAEAIQLFSKMEETYKLELLEDIQKMKLSVHTVKAILLTCVAGLHLPDTGKIKAIKLLRTSGAYWRGNEKTKC